MSEQRSDQWFSDRLGCLTASRLSDALDFLKTGAEGSKRKQYRLELVAERLTGLKTDYFETFAMREGTRKEPAARVEYEFITGANVSEVGFIRHPTLSWAGASPDGVVDGEGLLEIKCPTRTTHIQTLLDQKIPEQYKLQMAWQLICTGADWCDFASFCPEMPTPLNMFIQRYKPSRNEIELIEAQSIEFLESVESIMVKLETQQLQF